MNADPEATLAMDSVLVYLNSVRVKVDEQTYAAFLRTVEDLKASILSLEDVIREIKRLFRGKNDLIQGFHIFLPPDAGYMNLLASADETEESQGEVLEGTELAPSGAESPSLPPPNGSLIFIKNSVGITLQMLVEGGSEKSLLLSAPAHPLKRLCSKLPGKLFATCSFSITAKERERRWAMCAVPSGPDLDVDKVVIKSALGDLYLSAQRADTGTEVKLVLTDDPSLKSARFHWGIVSSDPELVLRPSPSSALPPPSPSPPSVLPVGPGVHHAEGDPPRMTADALRLFADQGFIQLPALVDDARIEACRRVINHYLGKESGMTAGGAQTGFTKPRGDLSNHPNVRGLLASPALHAVLSQLVGGASNLHLLSNQSGQVALRFPEHAEELRGGGAGGSQGHVDLGTTWHTDGHRQGRLHPFTVLVGVCLQDHTTPFSGNLLVWPGSHHDIHPCVTSPHGFIDMKRLHARTQQRQQQPPVGGMAEGVASLGEPMQVLARRGDVLLLHPDTAHAGGPNSSSEMRYMVYFRVKHSHCHSNSSMHSNIGDGTQLASWSQISARHRMDMFADLHGVKEALLS
jgi:hypothetical protein